MKPIPFLKPNLVKREAYWKYLEEIDESRLYSNFGPLNSRFEKRILEEYFANTGAVSTVNNATSGLMLAISQAKCPKGRYALMPSFTFAATPLAAMWCGLEPYFIDIVEDEWCMDPQLVSDALEKLGDEVAVVIPYATFGSCIDLSFYNQLHCSGVPVVVDAAASFGAKDINERQFGQEFPGAVVFSFHATKAFGIGEGGAVYSRDLELIAKIRQAENFGFSSSRETEIIGLNAKLPEIIAAIGLATLDVFSKKIEIRQSIYTDYVSQFEQKGLFDAGWALQSINGRVPFQFIATTCPENQTNLCVAAKLAKRGIECRTYFSPACHQQSSFENYPRAPLPITEKISREILSLPLREDMTRIDIATVAEGLKI